MIIYSKKDCRYEDIDVFDYFGEKIMTVSGAKPCARYVIVSNSAKNSAIFLSLIFFSLL